MNNDIMPDTDDLELVRGLLVQPAPSAQVQSTGRQRLISLATRDDGVPPRRRRTRITRPAVIGAGATLAAGAAALAIFAATAGTGVSPARHVAGGHGGQTVMSARDILLTAARHAASAPAATGRYWITKVSDGTNVEVGPAGNRYTITMTGSDEQWTARAATGSSWFVSQSLGARPASAADAAAWQRDGSPTHWSVPMYKGNVKFRMKIASAQGKPFGGQTNSGDKVFAIGGKNVSMREVRALPATPAALKAELLQNFAAPGGSGGDLPINKNDWLWQVGTSMITAMPLSPNVRAADYRMLAALPGVKSLGSVRDAAGREGIGVASTSRTQAGGAQESLLIVNPATGLPMDQELRVVKASGSTAGLKPGSLASYQVIKFAGWSNSTPTKVKGE